MEDYGLVVNVDVAVERDGSYLFIERSDDESHAAGLLAFPGGKIESPPGGEDAIAATARREVREEVGVDITEVEYVHSETFVSDTGTECLNVVTTATHDGGDARVREPEEIQAVHWLTPRDVRERPEVPEYLDRYVSAILDAAAD